MTVRPFLTKFEILQDQQVQSDAIYDPARMILVNNGMPAIFDTSFKEANATRYTKVKQETTDDQ